MTQKPTGLCSEHRDGENAECRLCYPLDPAKCEHRSLVTVSPMGPNLDEIHTWCHDCHKMMSVVPMADCEAKLPFVKLP